MRLDKITHTKMFDWNFLQGALDRLDALGLNAARPGSKTANLSTFATSSPLGSAGALEMAARARSALLGRSKQTARTRSPPPGCSKFVGLVARKHCACRRFRSRASSAPLGRSALALGPARLCQGVEIPTPPPPQRKAADPGQARAAMSSQLRLQAKIERPFRASCGSGPGSTDHFEPPAFPGQARSRKPRQVRRFRARPLSASVGFTLTCRGMGSATSAAHRKEIWHARSNYSRNHRYPNGVAESVMNEAPTD